MARGWIRRSGRALAAAGIGLLVAACGGGGGGGSATTVASADTATAADEVTVVEKAIVDAIFPTISSLRIPTQPNNLTPQPFPWAVGCGVGLVGNLNGKANNNPNVNCVPTVLPTERILRNGAFKAPGLRNVKFTGPYMHNGGMMKLDQVFQFYSGQGHFPVLNFNNLDAGIRLITLAPDERAAVVEMMETGLTDWNVAFKRGKFDHPELCLPDGHDSATGATRLRGLPAVGSAGGLSNIDHAAPL